MLENASSKLFNCWMRFHRASQVAEKRPTAHLRKNRIVLQKRAKLGLGSFGRLWDDLSRQLHSRPARPARRRRLTPLAIAND
jgi:hypothetical protein